MKRLTIEECKRVAANTTCRLQFPTLDFEVLVRVLGEADAARVQALVAGKPEAERNAEAELLVCSIAIVDDDGKLPFDSPEGLESLRQLPVSARRKICDTVASLAGLDAEVIG